MPASRPRTPGKDKDKGQESLSPILEDSETASVGRAGEVGPSYAMSPAQLSLERALQNLALGVKPEPAKADNLPKDKPARTKPRLLLMGQRRSGKSSISSVVFHKLAPNETLFLESTARTQKDQINTFMDYFVWDFPGQMDIFDESQWDLDSVFAEIGALIWIIDAQDDYLESVARLNTLVLYLQRCYAHINVEVFIHKVDGLSEEFKLDIQRDITIRIQDELSDHGFEDAPVTFHLTSIYNHSIFEAFSKVIQKLIPQLGSLEAMLDDLARNCHFEKCYLFDSTTKIYIATDSASVDTGTYELCSDFIDVIIDITDVYGSWKRSPESMAKLEGPPWNQKIEDQIGSKRVESQMVMNDGKKPLILREITSHICLVALMQEATFDKIPLVDLNIAAVTEGIHEFFRIIKFKT